MSEREFKFVDLNEHQREIAEQVIAGLRVMLDRKPTFEDFQRLRDYTALLEDAGIEVSVE